MSKSSLRKFKKNDYSYDDEEDYVDAKAKINKSNQRRFERALKTKDISLLVDNDFMDDMG